VYYINKKHVIFNQNLDYYYSIQSTGCAYGMVILSHVSYELYQRLWAMFHFLSTGFPRVLKSFKIHLLIFQSLRSDELGLRCSKSHKKS